MMSEYALYYKQRLPTTGPWPGRWDLFLSAFNTSERVRAIAQRVKARRKVWLILPEYDLQKAEHPSGEIYESGLVGEAEYLAEFVSKLGELAGKRVLVDITGFINHYVPVLLALLAAAGPATCDVVYGEPLRYLHSERTRFSDEAVMEVRQLAGFEGVHTHDTSHDLLVLGVGYDFRLVAEVANYKEHARKVQLFGLPSLRPDMYQESLLRASRVAEAIGPEGSAPQHYQYAPAHDPFVTAEIVSTLISSHRAKHPRANVYLAPLSTKAQTLGFAVLYLRECRNTATSIVYPFCRRYMKETSEGLSGAWLYRIEVQCLLAPQHQAGGTS